MIDLTPEQAASFREAIKQSGDAHMALDVGYFIIWFSAVEMAITNLLSVVSGSRDLETFDTLCSGMDARVKIERLRKIRKTRGGIGPNLDARLKYFDEKARPIRNRLAHAFMGRAESGAERYFASSLSSLPWKELNEPKPAFQTSPPVIITPAQLLGWGAWFTKFGQDLSAAFNLAIATGEVEIKTPLSTVPPANQGTPSPKAPRATRRKRDQKTPE